MTDSLTLLLLLSASIHLPQVFSFGVEIPTLHTSLSLLQNAAASFPPPMWMDHPTTTIASASAAIVEKNPLASASIMYSHALKTEPMQTKVITGIFLAIGGDAIAQAREPHLYDAKRAYSFAAFDGCYRAIQQITYPPLMEYCQGQFLLGLMGTLGMTTSENTVPLLAAFEQTLVSQLVIIPTLYYPFFYAITGTVQGLTIKQTIVRAQETFIPLMKRNLLFWIPVQFAVFGFVEESLQIPILIVCGLVWTVILSVVAGSVKVQEEEDIGGLALQEEAYCVTGMEGGCLIDPDDLFHAPKVLQSADEGMLLDGSIGSAESLVVTIEPRETAGEGESLTIEPLLQARGSETVKTGANQTEDVLN